MNFQNYTIFGYGFLQNEKKLNFFDKPEDAKKYLPELKLDNAILRIEASSGNFDYIA